MFVKQSYYLEPEPLGQKAFQLLRAVLAESELQAVCKIVLKDREQLAALDPFGPTMLLSTLYWPDEVRDLGDLDLPAEAMDLKPAELDMARQLVAALTGEFDASRYRDEYRDALLSVIEAKVAGQPIEAPAPASAPSKLTDLMAVLEASVAAARAEADGTAASDRSADDAPAAGPPVSVAAARKRRSPRGTAVSAGTAASATRATARRRKSA